MTQVFQATPLLLDREKASKHFFSEENKNDRDTLAGGLVIYQVPRTADDLFEDDGLKRFPGLERRDLPCLWVEDESQEHFKIPLAGLSLREVGEVVSDLGDAAENATSLAEWKSDFEKRQLRRVGVADATASENRDALMATSDKPESGGGKPDPPRSDGGLLTSLGRIAGVGGIALGVFYLLLRPLHFSVLDGTAARLLMFLVYGVTVLGLIVWGANDGNRRVLALILAVVAVVIAYFGARGGGDGAAHREYLVTITVAKPDGSVAKTNEATVWISGQTVLGNADGASWSARLPADNKGQTFDIHAEVPGAGLVAENSLTLDDDRTPKPHLKLAAGGVVDVTVLVVDERGFSVPNAIVNVVGGAGEPTDAGGQRTLHTTAHRGDVIEVRAQMAPDLLADEKNYRVGSGPVTLTLRHTDQAVSEKTSTPARQDGAKRSGTGAGVESKVQEAVPVQPAMPPIQVNQQTTVVVPPAQPVSNLRLAINSVRIPDWFEVGEGQNNGNWPQAVILKIDDHTVRIPVRFTVAKTGKHQINMDSVSQALQLTKGSHTYGFTIEVEQLVSRLRGKHTLVEVPCLRSFTLDTDLEVNPFLTLKDTKITQCLLVKPADGIPQHSF